LKNGEWIVDNGEWIMRDRLGEARIQNPEAGIAKAGEKRDKS